MRDLVGKAAVVTGGGSGIGRGLVRALAAEGVRVLVADIELDAATAVAEEVDGLAVHVDVSDADSVRALADRAFAELGAVHVLCNNAGVSTIARAERTTLEDWRWQLGVNVYGVVHGIVAFLPRLLAQGGEAHIVNTGSVAGLAPIPGMAAYSTTKFAVVGLSEALRVELADQGIGVTVICPGSVNTRIIEAARNRPDGLSTTGGDSALRPVSMPDAVDPDELGRRVVEAIRDDVLYVTAFSAEASNERMRQAAIARSDAVLAALR
jgi:NAD(P)-dependent dehydrogenase (short-subunit alcohol dehydrogenase family)